MDENNLDVEITTHPVWTTNLKEKILAILMIPLAYIYYKYGMEGMPDCYVYLAIFVIGFVAFVEAMFWDRKRTVESFIFLALMLVCAASYIFSLGNVWGDYAIEWFMHLFAIYWVLLRSNCLTEGKTSHMFMWDGLSAFTVIPFNNFPLVFRTIASIFTGIKKKDRKRVLVTLVSIVAAIALLFIALYALKESDTNFAHMLRFLEIDLDWDFFWGANFSLIVAMYLYGLVGGCYRKQESIVARGNRVNRLVGRLNKVPSAVWVVFISLFSIFYILYFVLQGSYMFGAFAMILPEKFTFSQYARKGFGEMCVVMVINFALLWLTQRTCEAKTRLIKIFSGILTIESLMFAVIAFLKLFMYIQAYGFTPLRLQSTWLVVVLSFACVCIMISMYAGKKTARLWFIISAISLGALTLVKF